MPCALNLSPSRLGNNLFTASCCTGMKTPLSPTNSPSTSSDASRRAPSAPHPVLLSVKGSPPIQTFHRPMSDTLSTLIDDLRELWRLPGPSPGLATGVPTNLLFGGRGGGSSVGPLPTQAGS